MCGVVGWVDWERDLTRECRVLGAMTSVLAHRGPDTGALWLSARAAFGHRRLTVVDPAGGGQPMRRLRDGRGYVITYNGELYNTPELRRELEARGHAFQGYSDTEALLLAFMEWGPQCLGRLNGIFAFGIWNESDQELFLARDRLGVKPLFYTRHDGTLLFASEPKALLVHPDVPAEVDAEGLAEVMVMGPARTPGHGIFRGLEELRPGHFLLHRRDGTRVRRYWALRSEPHVDDVGETLFHVRELLGDTVRRQLVADVPVCCLLSGGLDSSAVTALAAAAVAPAKLRTYSVDHAGNDRHFRSSDYQPDADTPWAWRVSRALGTAHRQVIVPTETLVEALAEAVQAGDRPGMADVDSSLYLFCREIKREATVALSGEAADEVFGGYPWFWREELRAQGTFPWVKRVEERVSLLSREARDLIRPEEYLDRRYREALEEVPRLEGEDPAEAQVRELFYLNLTRFMPTLLDRKDRMSMAAGLEVRVPYCDHRLVEYMWNVPWAMKYGGREKGLLRRTLEGVLPEEVLWRRKSPYPKTYSPAYRCAVRQRAGELLADPASPLPSLIDRTRLDALARADGQPLEPAWFGQLMGGAQYFAYLIQVDAWLRQHRVAIR
ncbi:MAG: asparagine synthase (glutamine-hydrolyzing) [bacterium]|nr:asparagine synthase (glutamine-hydrolyzing) [bacterium]